jgi:hypothetical protein
MKMERDETKGKMSLKLHAFGEAAWEDKKCYDKESSASDDTARLYALAETIFEDAEKLESVGMDHLDAVLIAMMNYRRKQRTL